MGHRKTITLAAVMVLASSAAFAQGWGQPSFPRDGVCFFKDPNFKGDYFCATTGENRDRLSDDWNDEISSIRVLGRAEVTVYLDINYQGRSQRYGGDVSNLKNEGWDDAISSFRVRGGSGSSYDRGSYNSRPSSSDAERIVRRAYQDVLHRDPDPDGMRSFRSKIIDDGWTETQVRDSLRQSPEYRELTTMTPAKAQDIVRRAYLNVLKREPDAGAQGFVQRVMRDHWSQQDVERELRKSPEYKGKN